jgi:hypothetical protein
MHTMAGVLEQIRRSRRQLVMCNIPMSKTDERALELHAAMEILAEVFDTDVSDIDAILKHRCDETEVWPQEFCLAE